MCLLFGSRGNDNGNCTKAKKGPTRRPSLTCVRLLSRPKACSISVGNICRYSASAERLSSATLHGGTANVPDRPQRGVRVRGGAESALQKRLAPVQPEAQGAQTARLLRGHAAF